MIYSHIKNDHEFRRAYNKGRSLVSPLIVTYCFKKKRGGVSLGITTGKKIGNAVSRNRCRRIIREAFRHISDDIRGNWDIVFVARVRTVGAKSTDVEREMLEQLRKAGVIKQEQAS